MANWNAFSLELKSYLDTLLGPSKTAQGALASALGVAIDALEIAISFLSITDDPILAGLKLLQGLLLDVLNDLAKSGVYALFIAPTSYQEYSTYQGGYEGFLDRYISSFSDYGDLERPQVGSSGALGGVVLYISNRNPLELAYDAQELFKPFLQRFDLALPYPVNLTATPVITTSGLIRQWELGLKQPDALMFEWQEPQARSDISLELFRKGKFLLERSKSRSGTLILQEVPDSQLDPLSKKAKRTGAPTRTAEALRDPEGATFRYWEPVTFIEAADLLDPQQLSTGKLNYNFLTSSYAHILPISDPGYDNAWYYRVRLVPVDAVLVEDTTITFAQTEEDRTVWRVARNAAATDFLPDRMMPPSAPVKGAVPYVQDSLSTLSDALLHTFRLAYLLRYDASPNDHAGDAAGEVPLGGSRMLGRPVSETLYERVGAPVWDTGLHYYADPLLNDQNIGFEQALKDLQVDVVAQAQRFDPFGGIDEYLLPATSLSSADQVRAAIDSRAVPLAREAATQLLENERAGAEFLTNWTASKARLLAVLTEGVDSVGFGDPDLRKDVSGLLRWTLGSSALTSTAPNWGSLQLLGDILPSSEQVLTTLFSYVSSLVNSFGSSLDEVRGTISSVQDRLSAIEDTISLLDSLIEALGFVFNFDVRFLWVDPQQGGTSKYITEVLAAQNPPDDGPDVFSMGIALLFGGPSLPDLEPLAKTFGIVFGV